MKGELLLTTIKHKIEQQLPRLSKGQQKVAHFILKNPTYIGVHSASAVGAACGTSETTVIRFCYALELSGYAELQKEITMFLFEHSTNSTLGNYVSSKKAVVQDDALCEKVMGQASQQIQSIAAQIDEAQFLRSTEKIHAARRVYIVAAGTSSLAAQWLYFTLNVLRPNVEVVSTETSTLIRTLQQANQDDVVMVISLHRYFKEPIEVAEEMHKRGVFVIGITDTEVAPIHPFVDEAFIMQQQELSTIDVMPAVFAFLNTFVVGMMSHDIHYYNEQRVKYDDFQQTFIANRWS